MLFGPASQNLVFNVVAVTAAGTVQADATQIATKSPVIVSAVGDDAVGIKLPVASPGKIVIIKNTGAGGLKVWPYTGDAINAIAANSAITMATVTSAVFVCTTTALWQTIPTVPS